MRIQFSLRNLLIFTALVSILLGGVLHPLYQRQRFQKFVTEINAAGGYVITSTEGTDWRTSSAHIIEIDFGAAFHTEVDLEVLQKVVLLPNLRTLSFEDGVLTNKHLEILASSKSLEKLSLSRTDIVDRDIELLTSLRTLRDLNLSGTLVSNGCLPILAKFQNLEVLRVAKTFITLDELCQLRGDSLRVLDASYCNGSYIDLSQDGFGGLPNLNSLVLKYAGGRLKLDPTHQLPNLKYLDICTGEVSIAGLAKVAPNIEELALEPRRLSVSDIEELALQKKLKKLILHQHDFIPMWNGFRPMRKDVMIEGVSVEIIPSEVTDAEQAISQLLKQRPNLLITDEDLTRDTAFQYSGQRKLGARGVNSDSQKAPVGGGGFF
ncbi:MAG: hypothetical protein COA78_32225 [Blastopirellula sp.]|nr:MAG: hypothetical protein COA78_32225 [Blastopirellula sp.]